MIISDTKKFIFLHNPKAAGTSIRNALRKHYDTRDNFFWGPIEGGSLKRRVDKAHMAMDDVKVIFPGEYSLINEYFVFAFVRNPYERFVSSFAEYFKHYRKDVNIINLERKEIMRHIIDFTLDQVDHHKIRYDFKMRHFIPQHAIIYCGLKCKADYVGRLENIAEDITNIKSILNLEDIGKVSESNKQVRKVGELHHELPIKIQDIIKEVYENDFMFFNYSLQL